MLGGAKASAQRYLAIALQLLTHGTYSPGDRGAKITSLYVSCHGTNSRRAKNAECCSPPLNTPRQYKSDGWTPNATQLFADAYPGKRWQQHTLFKERRKEHIVLGVNAERMRRAFGENYRVDPALPRPGRTPISHERTAPAMICCVQ